MIPRIFLGDLLKLLLAGENGNTATKNGDQSRCADCDESATALLFGGLGAIGVQVANAAQHLGMTVYGYDPYISLQSAWNLNHHVIKAADVNDIYAQCDYICLHAPLTAETKHSINKDTIAELKQNRKAKKEN